MINAHSYNLDSFQNSTKPRNPNKLSIFYYNDTHGNSDEMAGLLTAAKAFKEKTLQNDSVSFVLSAGDNYSGADVKKNNFIVNLMQNAMNVFASAIGNHEIDGGVDGFLQATKGKNVNFVATNVKFDNAEAQKTVKKSMIVEKDGVKFGFVGAMPFDFKECTKTESQVGINVLDFNSSIVEIQKEVDKLKAQGIDKIILLSHIGYENDKQLAQNLDGVDIIIGGHTHKVVHGAQHQENIVKSKSGEPVIITQAGENGRYYGILNVEFNKNGTIKLLNNKLTQSQNINKSPMIEHIKNLQLGKSPVVGKLKKVDPMPKNRRVAPLAWTAAMADSMRAELGADIALINSANIRKVPKAGVLTQRDISESAPMKNELIKTKITQKQLVKAVAMAAKRTLTNPNGEPGLLQGSGFTYKIDKLGNLLEFCILDKNNNKVKLDLNNLSDSVTYSVAYDTFTAKPNGEYPELELKFDYTKYDFDKDKTMMDYLSKRQDKDELSIVNDYRLEIV